MKAATSHLDGPWGGRVLRIARACDRFWLAPANPKTLGLIRLLTGFLTLYVHLAYCVDLQEFFGKDAWSSLQFTNHQRDLRTGTPWWYDSPDWAPILPAIILPPDQESRDAVIGYIAELSNGPKPARDQFIAFLRGEEVTNWVGNPPPAFLVNIETVDPRGREATAQFIEGLPTDPSERSEILEYLRVWGYDYRQTVQRGVYAFSIWFHVTDPFWMAVMQGLIVVVTLLFAVGFCTRITSALTWLAAVSYMQRSPMTLFGGDTIMNVLLFYLMIGPSGAALSVDRLIVHWLARRKAEREGIPVPVWKPPQPMISANFALRLMQVHFCFIYFASGTSKLLGGNWWNGTAIYYTMANYEFAPLRYWYYSASLRWLCQHRWLWEIFMEGGSFFTLGLEISLPLLVWNRRLRPYYVAASMLLHTMIALTMGLVVFSLLMATLVSSFIPGEAVERFLARVRGLRPAPLPAEPTTDEDDEAEPSAFKKEKALAVGGTHVKAKD